MTVQITDITERPVLLLGWDANRTVYPTGVASAEAFGTAQANATVTASGVASAAVVGTAKTVASVSVSGIDAASGAAGSPSVVYVIKPDGVAGSTAAGTPQLNAKVNPAGIPSGASVGLAEAFTSMNPTGFTSAGSVGSPSLTPVMSPTGIAGTEQFGDADTLATVFIIPGPVDPSNDFGNAVVTKKGWIFRPPVNTYQWRLFKEYEGISLLKESGIWSEVAHPDLERTRNADLYLGGGRDHVVSTSLKAELEGLGYTVTEEIVTTEDYL